MIEIGPNLAEVLKVAVTALILGLGIWAIHRQSRR